MRVSGHHKIVQLMPDCLGCSSCTLHLLCLPPGLSWDELDRLDRIIARPQPMSRGQHLFRTGDSFQSLRAIRAGSVKTYTLAENGSESVSGFHLPGDLIGLDAIAAGYHPSSALTLEPTSVCEIPFELLEGLILAMPTLGRHLVHIMSRSIGADTELLTLLAGKTAEERLAAFLLSLSLRLHKRDLPDREFFLSMSRHDIGSYLGLALETVSRLFSRFQQQGLIALRGRQVILKQVEQLRGLAGLARRTATPRTLA